MKSTRPFPETFRSIREMQGISERQVSKRAAKHGAPGHSTLARVYSGEMPALPFHLEAIAAALGVSPDTFLEYRLSQVVSLFDIIGHERRRIRPISWEDAAHNLARFEELTRPADEGDCRSRHSAARHLRTGAGVGRVESA